MTGKIARTPNPWPVRIALPYWWLNASSVPLDDIALFRQGHRSVRVPREQAARQ